MKEKKVKRIPYGMANYERVLHRNCYYVDKTMYLRTVEEAGELSYNVGATMVAKIKTLGLFLKK